MWISSTCQQDSGWCSRTLMQCVLIMFSHTSVQRSPASTSGILSSSYWPLVSSQVSIFSFHIQGKKKTYGICLSIPSTFHRTKCPPVPLSLAQRTGFHLFLYGWLIVQYTYIEYFLYSSVVGMSHVWASVSGATINMGMRGPPFQAECICFGYLPRSGIAELYNGSIFSNPHAPPHISSWMD